MSDSIFGRLFNEIRQGLFDDLKPRMQAAMESAFDEAWGAAMQRLVQLPPPAPAADVGEKPSAHRTKPPSNVGRRAAWGTTKQVIQGAFASPGFKGMTPKGIADWGGAHGQKVAQSSVRTTLQKMHKAGEVRIRQGKYFPKPVPEQRAPDEHAPSEGAEIHTLKNVA